MVSITSSTLMHFVLQNYDLVLLSENSHTEKQKRKIFRGLLSGLIGVSGLFYHLDFIYVFTMITLKFLVPSHVLKLQDFQARVRSLAHNYLAKSTAVAVAYEIPYVRGRIFDTIADNHYETRYLFFIFSRLETSHCHFLNILRAF